MNLFETTAYAAEGAPPEPSALPTLFVLGGFILIFYLLIWRPQSKQRKEHQALMAGLSEGDEVVTRGGLVGQVNKVEEEFVKVQVADNVELRIQKSAVGATLPKGTLESLDES